MFAAERIPPAGAAALVVARLAGGAFAALRLADTKTTTNGVVIATYQPDEPTARKTTQAATH